MDKNKLKTARRIRRKRGLRKKLLGTPERPRLTVFRSSRQIYAQIVDDVAGKTLVSANSLKTDGTGIPAAAEVGKAVAEHAQKAGVQAVCFDRNGYKFHGRVKALADAAREAGLKF